MGRLRMCIFADIHYINEKPEWKVEQKLTDYAEPFTNQIIEKINNEIKPDICICLGDMIQASKNKNVDIKNIKYIWNKLQEIRVPFYTLLGNHELKMVESNKEILDIIGYERATFSINMKDYHLLFIGTDVNLDDVQYKTQYLSSEDLSFIENDLKLNKNKRTIIFSHFGIAEDNMKDNFWFENNIEGGMLRNRNELKVILKNQKNILAIFCGHQHWTKKLMENEIPYYMLGSLVENVNGKPDGVYFEVELEDGKINVIEKHLEEEKMN